MLLLTFSQISLYFSKKFSSFIKKEMHLVLSKFLLFALIFGRNMYKGQFFRSLQPMKYLKSCLPKGSLLDISIRY